MTEPQEEVDVAEEPWPHLPPVGCPLVAVTSVRGERDATVLAAGLSVALALGERPSVLVAPRLSGGLRPSAWSSPEARELELALRERGVEAAARGRIVATAPEGGAESLEGVVEALETGVDRRVRGIVASLPAEEFSAACMSEQPIASAATIGLELPGDGALAGLAVDELRARGVIPRLAIHRLGRLAGRRVLAGIEPGGRASAWLRRLARGLGGVDGQALPLALGLALALMALVLALAAIGAAMNGAARVQRAADLAAVSAVRSLRDDVHRLTAARLTPAGLPNPVRLSRREVVRRASDVATRVALANGLDPKALSVEVASDAVPLMARVSVRGALEGGPAARSPVRAAAVAAAVAPAQPAQPSVASGGGYDGPLAYRQGKPMRPDVASAFDRLAAAAARAGHTLIITSAFRSDAEQAALYAANPDPRWVAPPGRSLHRCGTELDLGPASAYGWLAGHAARFGFLRRYSWEPWHFGFVDGPAPCSPASAAPRGGGEGSRPSAVPAFVPAQYRPTLEREAAAAGVSAALLAAQLQAESGFNPRAVSPAGAMGIAQFMPGTAAEWGLANPFDPHASIRAQARLMAHLLARFGRVDLALAAYNAGPGAVAACGCVPPYSETRAYVARILAVVGGVGELAAPIEVRLVAAGEWRG